MAIIHREAVLHIPLSQYAFAEGEHTLVVRLRAAKGNLRSCTLYYGDRACRQNPVVFTNASMHVVASDLLFDYFEARLEAVCSRVCYYFDLDAGEEQAFYYSNLFANDLPTERSEFYQYPYIRREEIPDVPSWFKEAVIYNIFPDSFASDHRELRPPEKESSASLGGTARGVLRNLDYIQNMGFNCVYLNPIFCAGEYHRYDTLDYYSVDPSFGTNEEFAELVEAVHSRGMRIILDGVFNHCSWRFFAFEDVVRNGRDSAYAHWFYDLEYPVVRPQDGSSIPNYACFAYERKMPKLNTSHPDVRAYFMDICRYWIREYHIDGWRLDVANEVDREFWRAFRRAAKEENPSCVLVAEIWESAESWLRGDMFDSSMNYDFRKNCRDFFARGLVDAAGFDARVTQMHMRYPARTVRGQMNLLDSHDVSRFLSLCDGDQRKLCLATLFLMSAPGVPSVFYGSECGMTGVAEAEYRAPMPWKQGECALQRFFAELSQLRKLPCVTNGSYHTLAAPEESRLYAFARKLHGQALTVVMNAGESPVPLPACVPKSAPLLASGMAEEKLEGFGFAVWRTEEE